MHLSAVQRVSLNQKGQAAVFVLALLGVVLLCAVFLYQSGRITSEKMQLQNAADSAAFGAMVLEARSLNFTAYTNRAMVANEVAVGQLIGLLSWADGLTQTEEYADVYTTAVEIAGQALAAILIETVGGAAIVEALTDFITGAIDTMAGIITAVGEAIEAVLDVVVSPSIAVLSTINETYSLSQRIYHGATYGAVIKSVYQSLEDNVPGTSFNRDDLLKKDLHGARLSDLGVVALVGHIPSYWTGYTKVYSSSTSAKQKRNKEKQKQKKEEKKKEKETQKDDDNATDVAADDSQQKTDKKEDKKEEKKSDKKKEKKASKSDTSNMAGMGRFAATVREARDPFSSGALDSSGMPLPTTRDWWLKLQAEMHVKVLGFKIGGGVSFGSDSFGASELRMKDDTFIWSAADTSVAGVEVKALGHWYALGAEAPFSSGAFQAPEDLEISLLPGVDLRPSFPETLFYGKRQTEPYGGALGEAHLTAVPDAEKEIAEDQIETYKGLQPYRDMTSMTETKPGKFSPPFNAPYFLVGVTKPIVDISSAGPQFAGHFDLYEFDEKTNVDRLGAIAKAELYFSRPSNLSYFARKDKQREIANVFGPFWQARLVDTSDADRFLALAMQQKVLWLTEREKSLIGGSAIDEVLSVLDDVMDAVSGIVDRLLRIFL